MNKAFSCIATASLLGGALIGFTALPAQADSFTASDNSDPTAQITNAAFDIQPSHETNTDETENIQVTVADADTVSDIQQVTLCFYSLQYGDSDCHVDKLDPRNTVLMTWNNSASNPDYFTISATSSDNGIPAGNASFWKLAAGAGNGGDGVSSRTGQSDFSDSGYGDGTATSMAMAFRFHVSEVAAQGEWGAKVVALDSGGGTGSNDVDGYTVKWYGEVAAQRPDNDYGKLSSGGSKIANGLNDGNIAANGASDITMQTTDFAQGSTTLTNVASTAGAPDINQPLTGDQLYALDVVPNASFDDGSSAIRLTADPQAVYTGMFPAATTESGSALKDSFRLSLGANIPYSANKYQNTVTVGIEPSAETPLNTQ